MINVESNECFKNETKTTRSKIASVAHAVPHRCDYEQKEREEKMATFPKPSRITFKSLCIEHFNAVALLLNYYFNIAKMLSACNI